MVSLKDLRKSFAGQVAGAVLLGLAGGMAHADEEGGMFDNDQCILSSAEQPEDATPAQSRLYDFMNRAAQGETGNAIVSSLRSGHTYLCYAPGLDRRDACGNYHVASFMDFLNIMAMNPNIEDDDLMRMAVLHEGRHKQQGDIGLSSNYYKNVPETTRLIRNWLREADARAVAILWAYERELEGEPQHLRALAEDKFHEHMVAAFRQSLADRPGDMEEALRAAIRAFRENSRLSYLYDKHEVEWIMSTGKEFDPGQPEDTAFLDDEKLRALGEVGAYNYMNDDLIAFIRDSVTQEDYEKIHAAVLQTKQNPQQAVCSL